MDYNRTPGPLGGPSASVLQTDVSGLSDGELVERMTLLGRERCRVDAMLVETAGEMQRRSGGRATARHGLMLGPGHSATRS